MLSRIRVVLVDLPPLLADVITELVREDSNVEVFAGPADADLHHTVAATDPDVVILPADGPELPPAARRLLEDRANLRVLALIDQAQSGVVGHLAVVTLRLEEISKATLVEAIAGTPTSRSAGAWPPDPSGDLRSGRPRRRTTSRTIGRGFHAGRPRRGDAP